MVYYVIIGTVIFTIINAITLFYLVRSYRFIKRIEADMKELVPEYENKMTDFKNYLIIICTSSPGMILLHVLVNWILWPIGILWTIRNAITYEK